jgi:hypothetical protein
MPGDERAKQLRSSTPTSTPQTGESALRPKLVGSMTTAETIQVVSASLAAIAAGASWMSALQARKAVKFSIAPELTVQGGWQPGPGHKEYAVYTIHNAGGGTAKGVAFVFVGQDAYTVGIVGTGIMRSDESVIIRTDHQAREDRKILGIVTCRDVSERAVVWDGRGRRKHLRDRRQGAHTALDIFHFMHPEADISAMPCRDYHAATDL